MNSHVLRITRAATKVALVVSAFIIRHSASIVTAATVVHAWALKATVASAQRRVVAADTVYSSAVYASILAKQAADAEYVNVSKLADQRDLITIAVNAELATL